MISATINGEARVLASINGFTALLPPRVARVVTEFAIDVTANAKRKARVKTGRLRRSIHYAVTQTADGARGVVGTDVEYAGAIEQGFKGRESVREFVRTQVMAWGKRIMPRKVVVRAHSRNVDRKAHPFLVPALHETRPTLQERLAADLRQMAGAAR